MELGTLIFVLEFGGLFGLFLLFAFWQLRSLDQLDREEAEAKKRTENESSN